MPTRRRWRWGFATLAMLSGLAYLLWELAPWCGETDGESRSPASIANETSILIEFHVSELSFESQQCHVFVEVSGEVTGSLLPNSIEPPANLQLAFFAGIDSSWADLEIDSLMLAGFDGRVSSESLTSVGILGEQGFVSWISPRSSWNSMPPTLDEWLSMVDS